MSSIIRRFKKKPVFVTDAWTLQDFYQRLVKGSCEEIFYVTGVQLDNLRVLSRMCCLEYEKQSPAYVRATRKSSVNALIEMVEHDNRLHLVAHSHPGFGAFATCPSGTDIDYITKLQKSGAETIALIVSRNGFLRFWSVLLPFKLIIRGAGISKVKGHDHVYRFELSEKDSEQSGETPRRSLFHI